MSKLAFLKKKKVLIPLIIVVLIGGMVAYGKMKQANQPPSYDTAKVTLGPLVQTVDATGKLEAVDNLALRFEVPGVLARVNVKEGDVVKPGTALASLRLSDLNAAVAQASANLNQRLAGSTEEDKRVAEAQVVSAKASLDQAKIDAQSQINAAQAALDTAKNNLIQTQGGNNSQVVVQAYDTALATLQGTLSKLDDALTQADNVLGIDNTQTNAGIRQYFSSSNPGLVYPANNSYLQAKTDRDQARQMIQPLTKTSSQASIDQGFDVARKALNSANTLLTNTTDILNATAPVGSLSQATLDSLKTTITVTRSGISSQLASLTTQQQAITNAKNSLANYQVAYDKAVRDLDAAKNNAESSIRIRQAAYDQALANERAKLNPPREVDVAYYRATLSQAVANRSKAILTAPMEGKITKIGKKVGELVSSADVMFNLLSPRYEIQVDIPEVDIPKVKIGQKATITLDAFGTDTKLSGTVTFIDPASTVIQDVVYYRVRISLDLTDKDIKPGMTANASITAEERQAALYLPTRFVLIRPDGTRYVKTLVNGQEQEIPVKVGLRANEARLEILEGLTEGQEVVITKSVIK